LELDAVGVLGVEALRRPVVAGADEGAGASQLTGDALELVEGVDLPRQVVQTDAARSRLIADAEQPEVVVVGGTGRLHEDGAGPAIGTDGHPPEAEDVLVPLGAALGIAHVEDGVVQALDRHGPSNIVAAATIPVRTSAWNPRTSAHTGHTRR